MFKIIQNFSQVIFLQRRTLPAPQHIDHMYCYSYLLRSAFLLLHPPHIPRAGLWWNKNDMNEMKKNSSQIYIREEKFPKIIFFVNALHRPLSIWITCILMHMCHVVLSCCLHPLHTLKPWLGLASWRSKSDFAKSEEKISQSYIGEVKISENFFSRMHPAGTAHLDSIYPYAQPLRTILFPSSPTPYP